MTPIKLNGTMSLDLTRKQISGWSARYPMLYTRTPVNNASVQFEGCWRTPISSLVAGVYRLDGSVSVEVTLAP